jgi:hypothetical protein
LRAERAYAFKRIALRERISSSSEARAIILGRGKKAPFMDKLLEKLLDPQWLLIGGVAIALIAIVVSNFPQRPK